MYVLTLLFFSKFFAVEFVVCVDGSFTCISTQHTDAEV